VGQCRARTGDLLRETVWSKRTKPT